jgi:hypothetical protein
MAYLFSYEFFSIIYLYERKSFSYEMVRNVPKLMALRYQKAQFNVLVEVFVNEHIKFEDPRGSVTTTMTFP